MPRLENRQDRRSFVYGRLPEVWPVIAVLSALVLVACAPAVDPASATWAPAVELEVGVATDCEAGVDVVVVADGVTFTFAGLDLAESEDPELPLSGTVRVAYRRGAPYRITVTPGCDDARRTRITTVLVEGDARTILSTSSALGRGPVESGGGM